MIHIPRVFLSLAIAVAGAACSGDVVAPPSSFGTYELQSVDAKPLPTLLLTDGDYTFKAESGFYTLRADGTFANSTTWREEYQGWTHVSTHSFEGTFTGAGDIVTFVWPSDGRTWAGMLKNRELTITDDQVWLFRK